LDKEKSKDAGLGQQNGFSRSIFAQFAEIVKRHSKSLPPAREECDIYTISLLLPVSAWSIIMIGSGGLLLVVSHIFAIPVLVLWVRFGKKVNNLNWT